jgi:imidazolonepropionase-like amidohydrolase
MIMRHRGRKIESYNQNVYGPGILEAQGVPVAIHSDHPAAGSVGRFLMYEAAKASRWGLTQRGALASVTSTPANAMGIADRVGSLIPGYDADVVVWDRDPMLLGAKPAKVIIDGQVTFIISHTSRYHFDMSAGCMCSYWLTMIFH